MAQAKANRSLYVERLLAVEPQIAFVATRVDLAPVHRLFDRTVAFVAVSTVRKPAQGDERPKLKEVSPELAGNGSPELKLPEPGCVDYEAAGLSWISSDVVVVCLPFDVHSETCHLQVQTRLDGVEQRALAHSALAGDRGDSGGEECRQPVQAAPRP